MGECKVCARELNVKSMAKHLREVHKRPLPDTPLRGSTGFTPAVKKSRRYRDVAASEENQAGGEVNVPTEGRRKGRRSREERSMEEVNQRLARVSVSQESPARIHNMDSPAVLTERHLGAVISSPEKRVRKSVDYLSY